MVIRRYGCFKMYHLCKNERNELSNYHNNRINNFNNMKKKNLLFVAAAMVMAGCASDDMIGDNAATQSDNQVIGFNMSTPAMTRSTYDQATDHGKLGNMFIVWGEKNEDSKSATSYAIDATADNADLVFKNYRVDYKAGTANTTLSNTEDWEYVGATSFKSNVTPNAPDDQTIKYWDMNANDYTFTAVSAPDDEIGSKIKITKITTGNSTNTTAVYDKGYTIELADAKASVGNIYVADREHLTKAANSQTSTTINRTAENVYGGQVKFTFRNFQSKIRFGIYETVPGYKVVITGINYDSKNHTATSGTNGGADKFGIAGDFVKAGGSTKYTVTYRSDTGHEGEAQVNIADNATKDSYITTEGTTWLTTAAIAENTNKPTYDYAGAYTPILPNTSNKTNMTLKIAYKLVSEDTGEEIKFMNGNEEIYRTVEVPAAYCQWKSNYAYTYIFKISDKTADLYPITFDACVETAQIGNQETITEVSEPSITTFAVTSSTNNAVVTEQEEYKAGNVIYASVVDANATSTLGGAVALTAGTNINLYTVEAKNGTNLVPSIITEASVANCLAQTKYAATSKTPYEVEDLNGNKLTVTNVSITQADNIVAAVPTEEGTTATRDLNALKWSTTEGATEDVYYVVEYIKGTDKYYKVVKVAKK